MATKKRLTLAALERRLRSLEERHDTFGGYTRELFIENRNLRDTVGILRQRLDNLATTVELLATSIKRNKGPEPVDAEFEEVVTVTWKPIGLCSPEPPFTLRLDNSHRDDRMQQWQNKLSKRARFIIWAAKFARIK